jgi:hypothetical protein
MNKECGLKAILRPHLSPSVIIAANIFKTKLRAHTVANNR